MNDLDFRRDVDAPNRSRARRVPGPRSQRGRELKRKRRKLQTIVVAAATLMAAIIVTGTALFVSDRNASDDDRTGARGANAPTQQTWLMAGSVESRPESTDWLTVVSYDSQNRSSLFLYIPRSTYVEIPGHGLETIDKARTLGGPSLLVISASNLLGIDFDHIVQVSDQGFRALVDKIGGVQLDIETKLTRPSGDGRVQVVFSEGEQHLNGERAAEFLLYTNENGEEISRAVRHSQLWGAIFAKLRQERRDAGKLFAGSKDLFETDATPKELSSLFGGVGRTPEGAVVYLTLPVESTGVGGGTQLYSPQRDKIDELVSRYLAASRPGGTSRKGRRVEILNGNGTPGIGQKVSEQLIPEGFRVILNQNANSFGYEKTQIVVYSDSKTALEVAQEVKRVLGVGEILISRQSQTIVDVTIVVGKDYLEKER